MSLLQLFTHNLLPVFLAAGAGYLLAWRGRVDPRPLAQVAFYILSPCLVYQIIVENGIKLIDWVRMAGFVVATVGALSVLAFLVARRMRWPRTLTAAVVLVVLLPNAGNFGLSVSLFAFGEEGLAQASLYFVTGAILSYTVGVFVASLGRESLRSAGVGLFRVPAVWAVVLGFAMAELGRDLPFAVGRTVDLLADACIPVFLVVLGMQLQRVHWGGRLRFIGFATGLRLVGGIAVALLLAPAFGLEGVARQAGVLQSAMPSAVITIILATQYEVEPETVTSVVFTTTVLCPLTLTPLLAYLGA
jgi:predicted permease